MNYCKDLTGQRFGRLIVIERDETKYGHVLWRCECDCGKKVIISGNSLLKGATKSCGCLHSEIVSEMKRKPTQYIIVGDVAICTTSKGTEFYIDVDDIEKVVNRSWNENYKGHLYGCVNGKHVFLHRYLMGVYNNDLEIDHKNRNKHDNRKDNLRVCTSIENSWNIGIRKNNSSGHTGVCWDNKRNKWRARITVKGKEKMLGRYERYEDAVMAREEAEKYYYNEYAPCIVNN